MGISGDGDCGVEQVRVYWRALHLHLVRKVWQGSIGGGWKVMVVGRM